LAIIVPLYYLLIREWGKSCHNQANVYYNLDKVQLIRINIFFWER